MRPAQELHGVGEMDAAPLGVSTALRSIVLDPHRQRFSGYGAISPEEKQPEGETIRC
jgi:hypothetical protein